MASSAPVLTVDHEQDNARLYSVCCFDDGLVVPRVTLLEAGGDDEAIRIVRSMNRLRTREIWDRHRLVKTFRPER